MKFSHNGEYLATAGQDRVVRVWALDREEGSGSGSGAGAGAGAAKNSSSTGAGARKPGKLRLRGELLFQEKPHREYSGHKGDVLDLCWSHTAGLYKSS
jgi:WD40 repeat protein